MQQPLIGRQYLHKDLHQLHGSLGPRYKQLLEVGLSESFDPLIYSARSLITELRSVQKQLADAIPKLKQFVRFNGTVVLID